MEAKRFTTHEPHASNFPSDHANVHHLEDGMQAAKEINYSDHPKSSFKTETVVLPHRRRYSAARNSDADDLDPSVADDNDTDDDDDDDGNCNSLHPLARNNIRLQRRRNSSPTDDAEPVYIRRRDISISRKNSQTRLSRSSTRTGQRFRAGSIPPRTEQYPVNNYMSHQPELLVSGLGQYAVYPVMGFNMAQQASIPQNLPPCISGPMLPINPFSSQMISNFPHGYLVSDNSDDTSRQFLQFQQQAALLQHQQLLQQQSSLYHPHFNPSANLPNQGNNFFQSYATVGRPNRSGLIPAPQLYGFPQSSAITGDSLQGLGLVSSDAWSQANAVPATDVSGTVPSTCVGDSASVVYENSVNSNHRQYQGVLSPAIIQDPTSTGVNCGKEPSFGKLENCSSFKPFPSVPTSQPSTISYSIGDSLLRVSNNDPNGLTFSANTGALGEAGELAFYHQSCRDNSPTVTTATIRQNKTTPGVVVTSRPFWRCSWHYWVILVCALAFLLTLSFAVFFSENAKWLENRLHEKYTQDPKVFGFFNPNRPPYPLLSGQPFSIHLESMGLWSGYWMVSVNRCAQYNITVSSALSSIGLFLRHNTMPTIVHYNHFDRILGRQLRVESDESPDRNVAVVSQQLSDSSGKTNFPRKTGRVRCLTKGIWFISIINDQPRNEDLLFSIDAIDIHDQCPNNCKTPRICSQGPCDCSDGIDGLNCSKEFVICNGHGEFSQGTCRCYPEWKGSECGTLWLNCLDPACSGHGRCISGLCQCDLGYAGETCQLRSCGSLNCSSNGVCHEGVCRCFNRWSGENCDRASEYPVASTFVNNLAAISST